MATKQDLIEVLERTNLFVNINIYGDLDLENNELVVEYKQNPLLSRKEFEKGTRTLGDKLFTIREMNHPEVFVEYSTKPDKHGVYSLTLTRIPLEGVGENLTSKVINTAHSEIQKSYLWQTRKKQRR